MQALKNIKQIAENIPDVSTRPLKNSRSVSFVLKYRDGTIMRDIHRLLRWFLAQYDLRSLTPILQTSLNELIMNAIKANQKRIYFAQAGLDIQNDYARGLPGFQHMLQENEEKLQEITRNSPLSVQVTFHLEDEHLTVTVVNDSPLHEAEKRTIQKMITRAGNQDSLNPYLEDSENDTAKEGAGLGLTMISLIIRNAGLPLESLRLEAKPDTTNFTLHVNRSMNESDPKLGKIREILIENISTLPVISEKYEKAKYLLDQKEPSSEFFELLYEDPCMVVNLLHLANRGSGSKNIKSPEEALEKTGAESYISFLEKNKVQTMAPKLRNLFRHSQKVSQYAKNISETYNISNPKTCQVAGLIHELGRLIVQILADKPLKEIRSLSGRQHPPTEKDFKESTLGISHGMLGGLLARAWNIPEELTQPIFFYYRPLWTLTEYQECVTVVHLANQLVEMEKRRGDLTDFEPAVLTKFGLEGERDIDKFAAGLRNSIDT